MLHTFPPHPVTGNSCHKAYPTGGHYRAVSQKPQTTGSCRPGRACYQRRAVYLFWASICHCWLHDKWICLGDWRHVWAPFKTAKYFEVRTTTTTATKKPRNNNNNYKNKGSSGGNSSSYRKFHIHILIKLTFCWITYVTCGYACMCVCKLHIRFQWRKVGQNTNTCT